MKNAICHILLLFCCSFLQAQNISFQMTSEGVLQDSDVGDMEFGDIDNDGDIDLLISGNGSSTGLGTELYANDGSGNFTAINGTPFPNASSTKFGFIDFDDDGFLDIYFSGNASPGGVVTNIYINDGTGSFNLLAGTPFEPTSEGDFVFDDLDGDNDKDLLLSGYDTNNNGVTKLYLNDGNANFVEDTTVPFLDLKGAAIELIDIEDDQDEDVLLVGKDNNGNKQSLLYTNDGNGNFSLLANTPFDNCSGGDIDVADSDNDGDLDILISGTNTNFVDISKLYLNDGLGVFNLASITFPGVSAGGETHFADFDADGDQDVFLLGAGPGGVFGGIIANVYENQGTNNFVLADSLIGAYLSCAAIGDIDGDNDLDIVVGGTSVGSPTRVTRLYTNTPCGEVNLLLDKNCLELLPNTSPDSFKIQGFISNYTIEILNANEVLVQTLTTDFNKIIINIPTLPTGLHFIKVVDNTTNLLALQRIIKQ